MELQASRIAARTDPDGAPILLQDQDRGRWDRRLVRRGLDALAKTDGTYGPYALQAAIAACHVRADHSEDTDWTRIAALYDVLTLVSPSPIVELNRAVAVAKARGAAEGLAIVDTIDLPRYALLAAVRGDLLAQLGHRNGAREEFERATALTRNDREQQLFAARAAALAPEPKRS
jgi:predicted RNA polymerase sigma factor